MNSNKEVDNFQSNSINELSDIHSESNSGCSIPSNEDKTNNEKKTSGKGTDWKEYGLKWIEPLNIVTIALAIFTYLLFRQATNDSKMAERSSNAAQEAVSEQRYNDSVTRYRDSIKFSNDTSFGNKKYREDSIISNKNFKISKNALQAQINTLKQTQIDFEIENRPFLVFSGIKLDTTFKNNMISIPYILINVGKFPAKLSLMAVKVNYGQDTANLLSNDHNWAIRPSTEYLSNNTTITGTASDPTTPNIIRFFRNGVIHIFVYFDVRYYSSVLKKTYSNYSVWQITLNRGRIDVSAIQNKER